MLQPQAGLESERTACHTLPWQCLPYAGAIVGAICVRTRIALPLLAAGGFAMPLLRFKGMQDYFQVGSQKGGGVLMGRR